jgi:hypothetical protein
LYALLLGIPKGDAVTLKSVRPRRGSEIHLLGYSTPLAWVQQGDDIQIGLGSAPRGEYAMALSFVGGAKE